MMCTLTRGILQSGVNGGSALRIMVLKPMSCKPFYQKECFTQLRPCLVVSIHVRTASTAKEEERAPFLVLLQNPGAFPQPQMLSLLHSQHFPPLCRAPRERYDCARNFCRGFSPCHCKLGGNSETGGRAKDWFSRKRNNYNHVGRNRAKMPFFPQLARKINVRCYYLFK